MKVLIVDDHPLVREGLRNLLAGLEEGTEVLEAPRADAALQALGGGADFDLVLLDLNLPDSDGLAVLAEIGREGADLPVVILSGVQDPALMRAALDGGAAGFIPKSSLSQVIVPALKLVLAGGVYVPQEMLPGQVSVATTDGPARELTARQRQVLQLLVAGKSNKEIAAALQLSEPTVKAHVVAVFRALQVRTRAQAVAAATRRGLPAG